MKTYIYKYPSILGPLFLASDGSNITGLWIEGQKYFGAGLPKEHTKERLPVFEQAESWLDMYFSGKEPDFMLPLSPEGSPFRKLIWDILCEIPYGRLMTYGDIAKSAADRLGKDTMSAQAVGGAVAHNPISIIIPCHRAVGSNGSLTGYAGGLDNKIKLLELENVNMDGLYRPRRGTAL